MGLPASGDGMGFRGGGGDADAAVMRVGELLIPIVQAMRKDLQSGTYRQTKRRFRCRCAPEAGAIARRPVPVRQAGRRNGWFDFRSLPSRGRILTDRITASTVVLGHLGGVPSAVARFTEKPSSRAWSSSLRIGLVR